MDREGRLAAAMTEIASADTPLAVDHVDRARGEHDRVRLRMTGRWLRPPGVDQSEPLLVVQVQGRRHRFPPSDGGDAPRAHETADGNGAWEATFNVPSWAEPSRDGQAAIWVGTAVVPVPVPGGGQAPGTAPHATAATAPPYEPHHRPPPPPALGEARPWPPPPAAPGLGEGLRPGEAPDTVVDTGRTGPLAELLFKESVAALHAELEQRSTDVARLQGSLANAQSELEARTAMQAALESAHSDLRGEVQELMSAVNVQREDFEKRLANAEDRRTAAEAERDRLRAELAALRDQLAAAQVSRDAAAGQAAGLRAELERLGSELAVSREHQAAQGGDLGEAQRLLAEARSLGEQLRSQSSH